MISFQKKYCFKEKKNSHEKTVLFCICHTSFSLSALTQTEGLNFQGVARNTAGEVRVSQKINLHLSILLGSESGTVAYEETRQVITNPQGVFAVVVGDDKALTKSTNFSTINWTPSPKFIKVEMDPNAGSNYLVMVSSRLQAVPFAFYAIGVDASNVKGVLSVSCGGTGVASISELKTSLSLDQVNNTSNASKSISSATQGALDTKVDKVAGKALSTNDYSTAEKNKLAAISGTNTGDQDLSGYATTAQVATKANTADVTTSLETRVDKVTGKELSTNDYTTAEKTKLAAITGTNTGDHVNITGNAGTATKLQNARTINGVSFDGSANITLPAAASGIPYIGATEAVDLGAFNLKVNGITIGRGKNLATDSNLRIGKNMLNNVTTGSYNSAMGNDSLGSFTTGYNNLAIGSSALRRGIGTIANTAVGVNAFENNLNGWWNVAIGNHALRYNTAGDNVAVGSGALEFNTSGTFNTGIGMNSLKGQQGNASTASSNTAIGSGALTRNITGGSNTANGANALSFNEGSSNNIAIGSFAEYGSANLTNATVIGSGAVVNASNKIRLGNDAVTVIEGKVSFTSLSDSRIKKNIVNSTYGLATVLKFKTCGIQPNEQRFKAGGFHRTGSTKTSSRGSHWQRRRLEQGRNFRNYLFQFGSGVD